MRYVSARSLGSMVYIMVGIMKKPWCVEVFEKVWLSESRQYTKHLGLVQNKPLFPFMEVYFGLASFTQHLTCHGFPFYIKTAFLFYMKDLFT
jgi:hypothetical protein